MEQSASRVQRLQSLLQQDPTNALLACEFVDAALAEGAADTAQAALERALAHDPTPVALRFRSASVALAKGDFPGAEATLAALLEEGIDDPVLRHNLALARFCRGDSTHALATLEPVFGALDDHPPLARLLARVLHRLDRPNDALLALKGRLAQGVEDAEARGFAALIFHEAGDFISAESAARTALALDPAQHEALLVAATLGRGVRSLLLQRRLPARISATCSN